MAEAAPVRLNVGILTRGVSQNSPKSVGVGDGLTARDMSLQMLLAREGLAAVRTVNLGHDDVDCPSGFASCVRIGGPG